MASHELASVALDDKYTATEGRIYLSGIQALVRLMEVHVLGLRDAAGKYSYLPFTAGLHPDVLAALARPNDIAAKQRANLYIERVNRQAGSDVLYLIDMMVVAFTVSLLLPKQASYLHHDK